METTKDQEIISLCKSCFSMTKTINGKCGKCGAIKNEYDEPYIPEPGD